MAESKLLIFLVHGHLEECSTICPVSYTLYEQKEEQNFLILPFVHVMYKVWTYGRTVFH